jgi:hypothetical protein
MLNIAAFASMLTSILAPALPYLVKFGEQAGTEASKKISLDAWEQAKTLWDKLHPRFEKKPAAQEAANDVADDPSNEDAQAALRQQLKRLLVEDSDFALELAKVLASKIMTSETVIDFSVNVQGGGVAFGSGSMVNNSGTISGRDVNVNKS